MAKFFNYLFYRIYWWNKNVLKEKHSLFFTTVVGVSAFYVLNYSAIVFAIFLYLIKDPLAYPKWIHIIAMVFIFISTYITFVKKYKVIVAKLEKEKGGRRFTSKDVGVIIYIVLTIVSLVFVAIQGRNFIDMH